MIIGILLTSKSPVNYKKVLEMECEIVMKYVGTLGAECGTAQGVPRQHPNPLLTAA